LSCVLDVVLRDEPKYTFPDPSDSLGLDPRWRVLPEMFAMTRSAEGRCDNPSIVGLSPSTMACMTSLDAAPVVRLPLVCEATSHAHVPEASSSAHRSMRISRFAPVRLSAFNLCRSTSSAHVLVLSALRALRRLRDSFPFVPFSPIRTPGNAVSGTSRRLIAKGEGVRGGVEGVSAVWAERADSAE